jgi:hypothetical protein
VRFRGLLSGFVGFRVLRHAAEHAIYGQWPVNELARHGYKLSAGTLYPMLHATEQPLIPRRFLLLNQAWRVTATLALTALRPPRGLLTAGKRVC